MNDDSEIFVLKRLSFVFVFCEVDFQDYVNEKNLRFVVVCFLEKKTCGDSTIPKVLIDTASLDQGRGIQRTLQNTSSINLRRNMVLSGGPGELWATINWEGVSTMLCFFLCLLSKVCIKQFSLVILCWMCCVSVKNVGEFALCVCLTGGQLPKYCPDTT